MSRVKCEYRQASKENWRRFCEANPAYIVDYVTYQNIIYTFNYAFRDHILETGDKGKLPYGIGDFAICKYKKKREKTLPDGTPIIGLSVDWKKTREMGKYIYHMNRQTEGYNFRWKWFVHSARFKFSEIWTFKPARVTSRMLRHYLTSTGSGGDYQYKYKEWSLIS